MKPETEVAQLSIVDGAWQESPDNLAVFDESALFEGGPERGSLFIVVEVTGDAEGRDALARELIETTRREYAASRGSIALALTQAVRAANEYFYNVNASTPREARRIAGMTAVVLREGELFIAQAGPGLACLMRGATLQRYPDESPWFDPNEAIGEFPTPGAVPIGLRYSYTPDLFHSALQPGDTIVLATRSLAHLLSKEELSDTLARRHPDEIVTNLEDLAGAADLSVIVLRCAGEPPPALSPALPTLPVQVEEERKAIEGEIAPPPRRARLALPHIQVDWARVRAAATRVRPAILRVLAGAMAAVAGIFGRVNWSRLGAAADRVIGAVLRGAARLIVFLLRASLPGEPKDEAAVRSKPKVQTAWRLAALVFPLLLITAGGGMWVMYRADQQNIRAAQTAEYLKQANAEIERAKRIGATDKNAARDALNRAMDLINQANQQSPNLPAARAALYNAQDELDKLSGVLALFPAAFATFSDAKAEPSRIVTRAPEVFILDRGAQRVQRYRLDETGAVATPPAGDGVILKSGDRVDGRAVGELIDMAWIDAGRLVVLDRAGLFLQYDPARPGWSARAATDGSLWTRVNLLASYVGNLYLADPARNQILKYVASGEAWTASVTYFAPGAAADLSNVVDMAIDGDVWLLRGDGSIFRYTAGRPNDLRLRDFDTPPSRPAALATAPAMASVYVADAGNQRIVQFDKATGRFTRQFKPSSQYRDTFKALKTLAVDEPGRKFFFISGNQAYVATIPQ